MDNSKWIKITNKNKKTTIKELSQNMKTKEIKQRSKNKNNLLSLNWKKQTYLRDAKAVRSGYLKEKK